MRDEGPGHILAIAVADVIDSLASKQLDEAVGKLATVVESLVDDQSRFGDLRSELAHQFGLSAACRIGNEDITDFAFAKLVNFAPVGFDPGQMAQARFACKSLHQHIASAFAGGFVIDGEHHGFIRQALECSPWF